MDIDPITLEVLRNKLDGIANEMQLTLVRSAFSAIVKEGLDASASLFTLQGETLAQALAIPVHLGALTPMVGRLLHDVPLDTMGEGDIWILNDTYLGGTHLPDIAIMMPVFADGRVIAISAAMTHHQDVGGMAPGSTPTNATEIFQEGIRIPLLQFRRGDALNDTLIAMLRQNVRLPDVLMGDINAQVAACTIGARRLGELAGNFGRDELLALFDELLNRSETMTRQALRSLRAGHLSPCRLPRQRRHRARQAGAHRGRGDDRRRHDDVRFHRHLAAGARAVQLHGVRALRRRLFRAARGDRSRGPHPQQRRLLPPDRVPSARGQPGQSARAGADRLPHLDDQAHHHGASSVRCARRRRIACRRIPAARSSSCISAASAPMGGAM